MVRVSAAASVSACARPVFELGQPGLGLAQFALQRQRTFAGRLAAGHRRVVEALALRRQEVGVRVARGQPLRLAGVLRPGNRAAAWAESTSSERPKPFSTLIASCSGVRPGSLIASSLSFEKLRPARRSESGRWRARHAGLEQANALFGSRPSSPRRHNSVLRAGTRPPRLRARRSLQENPPACPRAPLPGASAPGFSSRRTVSVE